MNSYHNVCEVRHGTQSKSPPPGGADGAIAGPAGGDGPCPPGYQRRQHVPLSGPWAGHGIPVESPPPPETGGHDSLPTGFRNLYPAPDLPDPGEQSVPGGGRPDGDRGGRPARSGAGAGYRRPAERKIVETRQLLVGLF